MQRQRRHQYVLFEYPAIASSIDICNFVPYDPLACPPDFRPPILREHANNFANQAGQTPPNRFPQIWGFMGAFLPLATIALVLRIVSRVKFSHVGADDISIIIAYVLYVGLNIATVFATKYGLGIHIWDVDYPRTGISMQKVCGSPVGSAMLLKPSR